MSNKLKTDQSFMNKTAAIILTASAMWQQSESGVTRFAENTFLLLLFVVANKHFSSLTEMSIGRTIANCHKIIQFNFSCLFCSEFNFLCTPRSKKKTTTSNSHRNIEIEMIFMKICMRERTNEIFKLSLFISFHRAFQRFFFSYVFFHSETVAISSFSNSNLIFICSLSNDTFSHIVKLNQSTSVPTAKSDMKSMSKKFTCSSVFDFRLFLLLRHDFYVSLGSFGYSVDAQHLNSLALR